MGAAFAIEALGYSEHVATLDMLWREVAVAVHGDIVAVDADDAMQGILLWRGLGEYDVASTQWSGDLDEQSLVACVFEVWPHAVASEWQGDAIALADKACYLGNEYGVRQLHLYKLLLPRCREDSGWLLLGWILLYVNRYGTRVGRAARPTSWRSMR